MPVNLRRLKYFVKIVDVGSLTQAADILHIAQPALSQQLATLEGEVNQQLLIRTKRGVTPTDAGKTLYRHAQSILRQCEMAQSEIDMASVSLSGSVSVGLAPGTAAQNLALPLMREVKQQHPGIVLYFNENVGATLTELIMNGRMDMAVTYDHRSLHGLRVMPLLKEYLYFVCPFSLAKPEKEVSLSQVAQYELFLPRSDNTVRKVLNEAFVQNNLQYCVRCEIESQTTLNAALSEGLGASILPESAARSLLKNGDTWMAKIIEPNVQACLSFCFSDNQPLSQPAEAVKSILLSLMSRRNVENHPLALVG